MSKCVNCKYQDERWGKLCPAMREYQLDQPEWARNLAITVTASRDLGNKVTEEIARILMKANEDGFLAGYKEGNKDALMVLTGEVENLVHAFKVRTGAKEKSDV